MEYRGPERRGSGDRKLTEADIEAVKSAVDACYNSYNDQLSTKVDDMYYYTSTIGDTTYLAIRGTDNKMNVIRDIRVWPTASPKGHVAHKGFVGAHKVLLSEAERIKQESKNLILTGHSLGGATALLLAEALDVPVITFGCPRVYFKFFKGPTLEHNRVICDDDPVPMIPKVFYKHLEEPSLVLYDNDGGIDVKDHNINVYKYRIEKLYELQEAA